MSEVVPTVYVELGLVTVAAGVVLMRVYMSRTWGTCKDDRSFEGKTVVITGGNSGIGKVTARELVKRGARVIIGCRNGDEAGKVVEEISRKNYKGQILYKQLNLASFSSVRDFADDVEKNESGLDVLINNAAVYSCPYSLTENDFETQFQVNHLSHALLTCLLLPKLQEGASAADPSRVINVTSTHYVKGTIRDDDFEPRAITEQIYDKRSAYNNSKLASACFSKQLAKLLEQKNVPINMYSASPGLVLTNLGRHVKMPWWKKILFLPILAVFVRTPYQGCQTILHCAISETLVKSTGNVFRNCMQTKPYGLLKDEHITRKVFEKTLKAISYSVEKFKV